MQSTLESKLYIDNIDKIITEPTMIVETNIIFNFNIFLNIKLFIKFKDKYNLRVNKN